jgi:Protein of unknown function (DUF3626)
LEISGDRVSAVASRPESLSLGAMSDKVFRGQFDMEIRVKPDESHLARLSPAQGAALRHVEAVAHRRDATSRTRVTELLHRSGCAAESYDEAMECVRLHARVVVHFHPDRAGLKRTTVAEALVKEGLYRNQFETGLSSGSLSAFPGGARDTWENTLFGGAYHAEGITVSQRPKYGALELIRYPDGPIPRFGSCYFVLRAGASTRTSFTFMGSEDPRAMERLGTIGRMHGVMAALLTEIEEGGMAAPPWPPFRAPTLGVPGLTVPRLLNFLYELRQPRKDPADGEAGRVLDTIIEAQVHGPIDLHRDVELLVADPAFAATATGRTLRELALRYDIPLRWHCGFQLPVREVPDDFRGPAMPRLARRIAGGDGTLDAAVIGSAATSLHEQPDAWRDYGSYAEVLQHLKQLWHVLVHYGLPARGQRFRLWRDRAILS